MGPFDRTPYRPRRRNCPDPVVWRRTLNDIWRVAAVIVLIVIAAVLAEWATKP